MLAAIAWLASMSAASMGCLDLIGHEDRMLDSAGGGGGTATGGNGGATACEAGMEQTCYSGPADTQDVGACKSGAQICTEDGSGFGACQGEVLPAQETCEDTADEDCDGFDCVLWTMALEGNEEPETISGIAVDSMGNIIVAGGFGGTLKIGADTFVSGGVQDIFVAKLSPSGEPIWSKQLGGTSVETAKDVAVDSSDNVVVLGRFFDNITIGGQVFTKMSSGVQPDSFVVKFSPQGDHIWSDAYALSVEDLATDSQGEIILCGQVQDADVDVGGQTISAVGNGDIALAKIDGITSNAIWAKAFGDVSAQSCTAVTVDKTGNVLVGGWAAGNVAFGANVLLTASDNRDFYVVRFDPQGNASWVRHFMAQQQNDGNVTALVADSTGAAYVGGAFAGQLLADGAALTSAGKLDVFAVKLSPAGAIQWFQRYGSSADDGGLRLAIDDADQLTLAGHTPGSVDLGGGPLMSSGSNDVFVGKLSGAGAHMWSRRFGDTASQTATAVAQTKQKETLLACSFDGVLDFGDGAVVSKGGDAAIAKLAP